MPRSKTYEPDTLADRALSAFWKYGFYATSMDDLVRVTKVSRHGIYSEFGGKKGLFFACFERYQNTIVSPAFSAVEAPGADLSAIADYFEHQIALAESVGLPGVGCFVANSSTEIAPQDLDVAKMVQQHNLRLANGFIAALQNSKQTNSELTDNDVSELANIIVVFANGLWSHSRNTDDASSLRGAVASFLKMIRERLA